VGQPAALYRVRQFFNALLARVSPDDLRQVDAILPSGAQGLFRKMSVSDQRHGLNVLHMLLQEGHTERDLLAAALLHDAGKSAAWVTPVHRTIIVLTRHFVPGVLAWLSRGEPRRAAWRHPFVIHQQHPEIGAQWAAQAGCSAMTVALIRRHQEPLRRTPQDLEEEWLVALQQADGIN
jgi:hypothetical protein